VFFLFRQNGKSYVGVLDQDSESFLKIDIPFSSVTNIVVHTLSNYVLLFIILYVLVFNARTC
jgi:hypothetical protein